MKTPHPESKRDKQKADIGMFEMFAEMFMREYTEKLFRWDAQLKNRFNGAPPQHEQDAFNRWSRPKEDQVAQHNAKLHEMRLRLMDLGGPRPPGIDRGPKLPFPNTLPKVP